MPYISAMRRAALDEGKDTPREAGELNYVVTRAVDAYLCWQGPLRYDTLNTAIGVLECAKLELYRRLAAPYEDIKQTQNGDVYTARGHDMR